MCVVLFCIERGELRFVWLCTDLGLKFGCLIFKVCDALVYFIELFCLRSNVSLSLFGVCV